MRKDGAQWRKEMAGMEQDQVHESNFASNLELPESILIVSVCFNAEYLQLLDSIVKIPYPVFRISNVITSCTIRQFNIAIEHDHLL